MNNGALQKMIVQPTNWCIIRQQEEEYLLYNSKTDELHLLSPMAFYVYQLCDGATPMDEIQEILSVIFRQNKETLNTNFAEFIHKLIARGIIVVLQ